MEDTNTQVAEIVATDVNDDMAEAKSKVFEQVNGSERKMQKAYRNAVYKHKKMLGMQWRANNYSKKVVVAGTEYFIEADGSYRNTSKKEKVKKGPKG